MDNLLDDERRLLDVLYREHQTLNGEWFIDKDNLSYIFESTSLKSSIASSLVSKIHEIPSKCNGGAKCLTYAVKGKLNVENVNCIEE